MGLNQTPKSKLGEKFESADVRKVATSPVSTSTTSSEKPPSVFPPPGIRLLERFSLRPKTISAIFVTCCFASLGGAAEATKWIVKSVNDNAMGGGISTDSSEYTWQRWDVYNPVGYFKIVDGYLE